MSKIYFYRYPGLSTHTTGYSKINKNMVTSGETLLFKNKNYLVIFEHGVKYTQNNYIVFSTVQFEKYPEEIENVINLHKIK